MANDEIVKLSEAAHGRVRLEMYLGSRDPHTQVVLQYENGAPYAVEQTWIPAVFTAFREILDNALDEVAGHGHGDRIDITYDPATMIFSVADNGRGIPIAYNEQHKMHAATLALSHARAGRNFGERGQLRGTNGIGASVVNFCSEWFHIDVERDGQTFHQEFSEGPELASDFTAAAPVIKKKTLKATGTTVTFKLSSIVFPHMTLPEDFIQARIYEAALCNPKISIYYNGTKVKVKSGGPEKNLFVGFKPIHIGVQEGSFTTDFWLIPHFFEDGEHQHSIVNSIPAFDGGVHMDTFKKYFFSGLLTALERESKKRKLNPNRSDLADGLLLYNITTMDAPNFNSQSKTRLNNEETSEFVKKALDDPDFFKNIIKKYSEWIDAVYARCAERTMKKDAADTNKLAKKLLRSKVAGLMDASGTDRSKCIIFLAEGLCMSEQTQVRVLKDGTFASVVAGDLIEGDIVVSHTHSLRPISKVYKKVAKTISVTTKLGSERFTEEHRLLAYSKIDKIFSFVAVKDLDSTVHQLVKSKLVDFNKMLEITANELSTEDSKLNRVIIYGNTNEVIHSTDDHTFTVFNLELFKYEMVKAIDIVPAIHAFVIE
jgi:DNA gyrase/topoisomerase IV subunit B